MADDPKEPVDDDKKPDPDDLGDKGKKALDDERKARRDAEKKAKDLETRLKELEDKDKSEVDKLRGQVTDLEKERDAAKASALRYEVAAEKGVKPRWLNGSTREELEEAADEYLADHPPADGSSSSAPRKPKEDLKGGGDPTEEPVETDPAKLAASVPRF